MTQPKRDDAEEIKNCRVALSFATRSLDDDRPLSQHLPREAHALLMDGVRGREKKPGSFRDEQNWIGPQGCTVERARFVPIPQHHLLSGLEAWARYVQDKNELDPLVQLTPDIDWIEWVRQQDGEWIVLTGEIRIRTVPAERDALRRARLRVLHVPKSLRSKQHHERCATLIWQWPGIVRTMASFDPPVMFEMSPRLGGRLKQLGI